MFLSCSEWYLFSYEGKAFCLGSIKCRCVVCAFQDTPLCSSIGRTNRTGPMWPFPRPVSMPPFPYCPLIILLSTVPQELSPLLQKSKTSFDPVLWSWRSLIFDLWPLGTLLFLVSSFPQVLLSPCHPSPGSSSVSSDPLLSIRSQDKRFSSLFIFMTTKLFSLSYEILVFSSLAPWTFSLFILFGVVK